MALRARNRNNGLIMPTLTFVARDLHAQYGDYGYRAIVACRCFWCERALTLLDAAIDDALADGRAATDGYIVSIDVGEHENDLADWARTVPRDMGRDLETRDDYTPSMLRHLSQLPTIEGIENPNPMPPNQLDTVQVPREQFDECSSTDANGERHEPGEHHLRCAGMRLQATGTAWPVGSILVVCNCRCHCAR